MVQTGGKRKASAKFLAAGKAWRSHLNEYRKKHPNLTLKQQMKGASKTYKKGTSKSGSKSGSISVKSTKYSVHIRPRRSRRTKKSKSSKSSNKSKGSRRKKRRSRKKRSRGLFF